MTDAIGQEAASHTRKRWIITRRPTDNTYEDDANERYETPSELRIGDPRESMLNLCYPVPLTSGWEELETMALIDGAR